MIRNNWIAKQITLHYKQLAKVNNLLLYYNYNITISIIVGLQ